MEQQAVSKSPCCRTRYIKSKSMNFPSSSPPLDSSSRSRRAKEMARWRWCPWLWRLHRWELSHRRLLVSASPRMETRLGRRSAVLDQNVFPARKMRRFVFCAESDRGLRSILNLLFSSTAIPTHRLYCCSGAPRAILSLSVCGLVCLHGKTWLPSIMLQACQTLFQYFRLFFEMTHHQLNLSIYTASVGRPVPYSSCWGIWTLTSETASLAFRSILGKP